MGRMDEIMVVECQCGYSQSVPYRLLAQNPTAVIPCSRRDPEPCPRAASVRELLKQWERGIRQVRVVDVKQIALEGTKTTTEGV